jgi:predicted aldo/keto reductase-like oxidoreductase
VIYRRFGRTELQMPVFSCGGMRYQKSWSRGQPITRKSQQNVEAVIDRALALGIDHIETARGYGTSEVQVGQALARHPRGSFKLQTKIRAADRPADFEQLLEESFAGLKVDYLDLFAFHGVNTPQCLERIVRPGGCFEVIESFRRRARIGHVGFSTHGPTRLIVAAIETGRFDYVNLHHYYVWQDNRPAIEAARAHDLGVFIISPTDKGGRLQQPSARLRALCEPLSPMAFNDLWCLGHPDIHTLSLGAARPSDFDEHVAALGRLPEAEALVPLIARRLEARYAEALGADFARRWREGLPEWWEMPGRINVRRILWLHNLLRAYDLRDFAQERYAAMSPDDHWVPGAHAADFDEHAVATALAGSPFREMIPGLLRQAHEALHNPGVEAGP